MKKISQNEARRLRAQAKALSAKVETLEWELRRFRTYINVGTEIARQKSAPSGIVWSVQTANKLGHVVLATQYGDDLILRALPLASEAAV